jgi:hypothetical protein
MIKAYNLLKEGKQCKRLLLGAQTPRLFMLRNAEAHNNKLTIAGVEVNALTEHDAITITPDEAKRLLEQDNRNFRKVSRGEVAKYINSMKEGKWRFNGDSIALDASGLVKDGQHRLIACMESQIPMKVFPIRINSDINIDNKKKLLFDAILAGMGYHYSVSLSALIKIIYRYESGIRNFYSNKEEIDNNTLIEFFKKNLDIVDSLNLTMPYFKSAVCHILYLHHSTT